MLFSQKIDTFVPNLMQMFLQKYHTIETKLINYKYLLKQFQGLNFLNKLLELLEKKIRKIKFSHRNHFELLLLYNIVINSEYGLQS